MIRKLNEDISIIPAWQAWQTKGKGLDEINKAPYISEKGVAYVWGESIFIEDGNELIIYEGEDFKTKRKVPLSKFKEVLEEKSSVILFWKDLREKISNIPTFKGIPLYKEGLIIEGDVRYKILSGLIGGDMYNFLYSHIDPMILYEFLSCESSPKTLEKEIFLRCKNELEGFSDGLTINLSSTIDFVNALGKLKEETLSIVLKLGSRRSYKQNYLHKSFIDRLALFENEIAIDIDEEMFLKLLKTYREKGTLELTKNNENSNINSHFVEKYKFLEKIYKGMGIEEVYKEKLILRVLSLEECLNLPSIPTLPGICVEIKGEDGRCIVFVSYNSYRSEVLWHSDKNSPLIDAIISNVNSFIGRLIEKMKCFCLE